VRSLRTFTESVIALPVHVHFSLVPVVGGAVLGVVLALVAAWVAARRALRIDVSAELSNRERRAEAAPRRLLRRALATLAVALFGMGMCEVASRGGALEAWQPPLALLGVGVTTGAFTLTIGAWGPLVIRSILRSRAASAVPASAQLAMANLVREPGRTGVMAVAIGSAVGLAFMVSSYNAAISQGITDNITRGAGRSLRVAAIPPTNNINVEGRVSARVVEGLRRIPGVARVDRSGSVMTGTRANDIVGVNAFEDPTMPLPLLAGTKDVKRLERGEAMVGAGLARKRDLRPGDRVRLPTPTGFVTFPVQGVWLDGDFNGSSVTVSLRMLEKAWGVRAPQQVFVQPAPGVGGETLRSRILAANLDPDLQVHTAPRLTKLVVGDVTRTLDAFWAAQRALVMVAFIAVLSTLLLVGVQRRRELATLVAVGMESRQLARLVMLEAGVVAVVAAVLSAFGAVGMFQATRQVLPIFIGFHDPFRLDFGALVFYAPLTIAVVLLASTVPAWRASRLEVVPALQYE
jgi:putative ABC transport system permease protein